MLCFTLLVSCVTLRMIFTGQLDRRRKWATNATSGAQPWGIIATSNLSEGGRSAVQVMLLFQQDSKRNQVCWTMYSCPPEYKPQFSISNVWVLFFFFPFWAKKKSCWGYQPVVTYIILATACRGFGWKWRMNTSLNTSKSVRKCPSASVTIF